MGGGGGGRLLHFVHEKQLNAGHNGHQVKLNKQYSERFIKIVWKISKLQNFEAS